MPGVVVQSPGPQFQAWAAAWISIRRATAPTRRSSSQCIGVAIEPPANWRP